MSQRAAEDEVTLAEAEDSTKSSVMAVAESPPAEKETLKEATEKRVGETSPEAPLAIEYPPPLKRGIIVFGLLLSAFLVRSTSSN